MRYSIKKNVLGKPNVHLHCPVCDEGLKVSLNKAGTQDVCPSCRNSFVVPGVEELNRIKAEEAAKREQVAQEKREAALIREQEKTTAEAQKAEERRIRHEESERRRIEDQERQRKMDQQRVAADAHVTRSPPTTMSRKEDYLFARGLVTFYKVTGGLTVAAGAIMAVVSFVGCAIAAEQNETPAWPFALFGLALGVIASGLITMGFGELMQTLIDMAVNSRNAPEKLDDIRGALIREGFVQGQEKGAS